MDITSTKPLSDEQKALVAEIARSATSRHMVDYTYSSEIIHHRKEIFAQFGNGERAPVHKMMDGEINNNDDGCHFEYLPVFLDGKALGEFPWEGKSGLLHLLLCRKLHHKERATGWQTIYLDTGWLYRFELDGFMTGERTMLEDIS